MRISQKILFLIGLSPLLVCCAFSTENKAKTAPAKADKNEEAAGAIREALTRRYASAQYPHKIESLLSALGANAGFGCQVAVREAFVKTGKVSEKSAFIVVGTKDGGKYFFGDFLSGCLMRPAHGSPSQRISVWSLIAGAAQYAGAKRYPDVMEISRRGAQTAGTKDFGLPRLPVDRMPDELPIEALRGTWPQVRDILSKRGVDPRFWGWISATAAQKVIIDNKAKLDPAMAAKIFMESALPMSRIDAARTGVSNP